MESVEAPWRTSTPGQSTSAAVLALVSEDDEDEEPPKSQFPSLSVIDCAPAYEPDASRTQASIAVRLADWRTEIRITHPCSCPGALIAAEPWRSQGNPSGRAVQPPVQQVVLRSEEHTSELQSQS